MHKHQDHPVDCAPRQDIERRNVWSQIWSNMSGLPMIPSLAKQFAASLERPAPLAWERLPDPAVIHGMTMELTKEQRVAIAHPELRDLQFEGGRWRAFDRDGVVTHSEDAEGEIWTGAYGRRHNPGNSWGMSIFADLQMPVTVGMTSQLKGPISGARIDHQIVDDVLDSTPLAKMPKSYSVSGTLQAVDDDIDDGYVKS